MKTVVIIAGGPSLTRADVALCEQAGLPLLGVNNAYQITSKLSWLYACDSAWWKQHHDHVGQCGKFSLEETPFQDVAQLENGGISGLAKKWPKVMTGKNSGHQALNLAYHLGFQRIILLGFDMMPGEAGELHWHADHRHMNNPNKHRLETWPELFEPIANQLKKLGIEVVNCSRRTALACFPKASLERALQSFDQPDWNADILDLGIVTPCYKLPNAAALKKQFVQSIIESAPQCSWSVLFITHDQFDCEINGIFSIAKAYNAGLCWFAKRAKTIVAADIDLLIPPGFLDHTVQAQKPYCHRVRDMKKEDVSLKCWNVWKRRKARKGTGAWNAMTWQDWLKTRGFNEFMYGWGGIDTDFKFRKNDTFGAEQCTIDDSFPLMHINHEPNDFNAPRRPEENMQISEAHRYSEHNWLRERSKVRLPKTPLMLRSDKAKKIKHENTDYPWLFPVVEQNNFPNPELGYTLPLKVSQNGFKSLPKTKPIIILSVCRSGEVEFNQKKFWPGYVRALQRGLEMHLTRPFEHWCITDFMDEVSTIPNVNAVSMLTNVANKYCKMELFRPDLHAEFKGYQIFTVDLDTVFIGNCDDLFSYGGDFAMLEHVRLKNYGASGFMSFKAGFGTEMYKKFFADLKISKKHYPLYNGRGDQLFINRHAQIIPHAWQELYPGRLEPFHSFKYEKNTKAGLIFFCGKFTPHKYRHLPWIQKHWRSET